MQQQFAIGQQVKAISFTDCFGKLIAERPNLTVKSVKLIWESTSMKPYYRVEAYEENGFGYVEGAERYFAHQI
jgi:hypothetical protein